MAYIELKSTSNDGVNKNVRLTESQIGDKIAFKLNGFNVPISRMVNANGRSFESVSLKCLYNGEEVYLNLTPTLKHIFEKEEFPDDSDLVINVVENRKREGSKLYMLGKFKPIEFTDDDKAVAESIVKLALQNGVPTTEIDLTLVFSTLKELKKDESRVEEIFSALVSMRS